MGRVLQKYKMGKFVTWEVRDGQLSWHFQEEKIAAELLLDGCYVITTDAKKEKKANSVTINLNRKIAP